MPRSLSSSATEDHSPYNRQQTQIPLRWTPWKPRFWSNRDKGNKDRTPTSTLFNPPSITALDISEEMLDRIDVSRPRYTARPIVQEPYEPHIGMQTADLAIAVGDRAQGVFVNSYAFARLNQLKITSKSESLRPKYLDNPPQYSDLVEWLCGYASPDTPKILRKPALEVLESLLIHLAPDLIHISEDVEAAVHLCDNLQKYFPSLEPAILECLFGVWEVEFQPTSDNIDDKCPVLAESDFCDKIVPIMKNIWDRNLHKDFDWSPKPKAPPFPYYEIPCRHYITLYWILGRWRPAFNEFFMKRPPGEDDRRNTDGADLLALCLNDFNKRYIQPRQPTQLEQPNPTHDLFKSKHKEVENEEHIMRHIFAFCLVFGALEIKCQQLLTPGPGGTKTPDPVYSPVFASAAQVLSNYASSQPSGVARLDYALEYPPAAVADGMCDYRDFLGVSSRVPAMRLRNVFLNELKNAGVDISYGKFCVVLKMQRVGKTSQ